MAKPLNTQKLMRQCRQIAAKQKAAQQQPEPVYIPEIKEEELPNMNGRELEQYLTQFLQTSRDAANRYNFAVAEEQYPNSAIQDFLHMLEFAPSKLDITLVAEMMPRLRQMRRDLKKELEVTEIFKNWADENKTALNKLENVLGDIRKVLARQPNDYYVFKTDAVGQKGERLIPDEKEGTNEEL